MNARPLTALALAFTLAACEARPLTTPANAAESSAAGAASSVTSEPAVRSAPTASADPLVVAYWNVENLFDTTDDAAVEKDEEFTPTGDKQWDEERYATKLEHLARVIRDMDDGRGPDVLGVSEVENRAVLEALVETLTDTGRDYRIVHRDSPSFRGIDCALLYDAAELELADSDFLHVDAGTTRDIVRADLVTGGRELVVYVNHWPSRGGDTTGVNRIEAAKTLRRDLDPLLASNPAAEVIVLGDLNDHPSDPSVTEHLRAVREPDGAGELLNTMWAIHDDPSAGTHVFRGEWGVLDHVIVSPGLLDDDGLTWIEGSTRTIANRYQMYESSTGELFPNRSFGSKYYGGYSDHLPVVCEIERR